MTLTSDWRGKPRLSFVFEARDYREPTSEGQCPSRIGAYFLDFLTAFPISCVAFPSACSTLPLSCSVLLFVILPTSSWTLPFACFPLPFISSLLYAEPQMSQLN